VKTTQEKVDAIQFDGTARYQTYESFNDGLRLTEFKQERHHTFIYKTFQNLDGSKFYDNCIVLHVNGVFPKRTELKPTEKQLELDLSLTVHPSVQFNLQ
jgi:hypothetical protein